MVKRLETATMHAGLPILAVEVGSAGTHAELGEAMCPQGAAIAEVDPRDHEARLLTADLLVTADLIVTADRMNRAACARLDPACRPRLFTWTQAVVLAEQTVRDLSQGSVPEGAPRVPDDPNDRLRWLVEEMDASRGTLAGWSEEDLDIADVHYVDDHSATLQPVVDAANLLTTALIALASMDISEL